MAGLYKDLCAFRRGFIWSAHGAWIPTQRNPSESHEEALRILNDLRLEPLEPPKSLWCLYALATRAC